MLNSDHAVDEALDGLLSARPMLSSRLLYNRRGMRLLEKAKRSPAYVITRAEERLIRARARNVAAVTPLGSAIIDYGGSSTHKVRPLLQALKPSWYVPLDWSEDAMRRVEKSLQDQPFRVRALVADFSRPLELPSDIQGWPRLGICTGLTLCNFDPPDVQTCLTHMGRTLGDGARLLLTIDVVVDGARQQSAYAGDDQALAAFMMNALAHLNREGGTNFDLQAFEYRPIWNGARRCLESSIVCLSDQLVRIRDQEKLFRKGDAILIVSSYKYEVADFAALACAARTGWCLDEVWRDKDDLCALILLKRSD